MSIENIMRTPFTPDMRKKQYEELKEYLETVKGMGYGKFEILYEAYYFISRPTVEDKEILELLSKYSDFVTQYWENIEMPLKEDQDDKVDEELEKELKENPLYQIAELIANGNIFVVADVEESILDYEEFCEEHMEDFMERGISEKECKEEPLEMCWIGLADVLKENGYAIEIGWREASFVLADKLSRCKLIEANSSLLNKGWFSMEEGVLEGCKILNKKWRGQGLCLAVMDIHCESYVFFPYKEKELEKLEGLAEKLGYVICHSKFLKGYDLESGK